MRTEQDLPRDQVGQHHERLRWIDLEGAQLFDQLRSLERGDLILQQEKHRRAEAGQRDWLAPLRPVRNPLDALTTRDTTRLQFEGHFRIHGEEQGWPLVERRQLTRTVFPGPDNQLQLVTPADLLDELVALKVGQTRR